MMPPAGEQGPQPQAGEAGAQPPATPPRSPSTLKAALVRGWGTALGRGAVAFAVMAILGQAAGFVAVWTSGARGLENAFKIGWVYYALFHRVGVILAVKGLSIPGLPTTGGGTFDFSYRVGFALLLATALAAWLLLRGGRAAAENGGGGPVSRAIHGAKVGPVYAVLSVLGLLFLRFDLGGVLQPFAPGAVSIRASLLGAFFMPLLLGGFFGALGGLGTAPASQRGAWWRRAQAVLSGGWRMLLLGLVLSFVGLLVNAVADPDATAAYFRGATEGSAGDAAVFFGHHISVLPNQSMLVLSPAMGACDGLYGSGFSFDLLCYGNFPSGAAFERFAQSAVSSGGLFPTFDADPAPTAYLLFLLVPLAAVLLGGRRAASGASSLLEAIGLGVSAGGVFAVLVLAGAVAAGLTVAGSAGFGMGFGGSVTFRFGPDPSSSFLVGLAWGVIGGGIGAALAARGLPMRPSAVAPPLPPAPPEPTPPDAS